MDLSNILPQIGISLGEQQLAKFGAKVQQAAGPVLANAARTVIGGSLGEVGQLFGINGSLADGEWNPTPYAAAIASGIGGFDPKQKFLFKVSFTFHPDVFGYASKFNMDLITLSRNLTFLINQIDLPKYTFNYTEANMYNFNTKVLTQIQHDDVVFKFYDDVGNTGLTFINNYLQLLVPSTRQSWAAGQDLSNFSMIFAGDNDSSLSLADSSNRSSLGGGPANILHEMRIDQYFLNREDTTLTGTTIRRGIRANSYFYTNPRLTTFALDSQDSEGDGPSIISCAFNYDSVYIQTGLYGDDISRPSAGFMEMNDLLSNNPTNSSQISSGGGGQGGNSSQILTGILVGAMNGRVGSNGSAKLASSLTPLASAMSGLSSGGGGLGLSQGASGSASMGLGTNATQTLSTLAAGFVPRDVSIAQAPIIVDNALGSTATGQFPAGILQSFLPISGPILG